MNLSDIAQLPWHPEHTAGGWACLIRDAKGKTVATVDLGQDDRKAIKTWELADQIVRVVNASALAVDQAVRPPVTLAGIPEGDGGQGSMRTKTKNGHTKMTGTVSLSRASTPEGSKIRLMMTIGDYGRKAIEVEMEPEVFGLVVTGLGHQPCTIQITKDHPVIGVKEGENLDYYCRPE